MLFNSCTDVFTLFFYGFFPERIPEVCAWVLSGSVVPTQSSLLQYLTVFGCTLALECPFYFLLLKHFTISKIFLILFLANLVTHPLVYWGFPLLFQGKTEAFYLMIAESFAIAAETVTAASLQRKITLKTFIFISLANLFSWTIGVL